MAHFLDDDLDRSQRPLEFYYSLFYKSRLQDAVAKSNLNQYASSGIREAEVFMMLAHLFSKTSDKVLAQLLGKTVVPWLEEHIKTLQDPREIGPAAWALGMAYSEGLTPSRESNHEIAFTYFQLSAANNHPAGMNNMGNQYRTPKVASVQVDHVEALKWFHRAAALGHASAKYNIGDCYLEGDGVEKNLAEAARWYTMAAEEGHSGAQNDLAWCYDHGHGVPQDSKKSIYWFRRAQENGDAEGTYNLAVCYESGRGVPTDDKEALRLYRLAAEEDHGPAMVAIGLFYRNGKGGLMESTSEAIRWFRRAADLKLPEGQLQLALAYEMGDGVEENLEEAFRLYQLAAEQGSGPAQASLGNCYANGLGVAADVNEAAKWLLKAAKGDNSEKQPVEEAQYYYGGLLRSVEKHPERFKLAPEHVEGTYVEWYTKAAELGFAEAQYMLVLYYLTMMPDEEEDVSTEYEDTEEGDEEEDDDEEEEEEDDEVDFDEISIDGVESKEDQKVQLTHDTTTTTTADDETHSTSDVHSPDQKSLAMKWLRRLLHEAIEDESIAEMIAEDCFLERCMDKSLNDVILTYLEAGMDMNSLIPAVGMTPLELAIRCYSPSIATILIEHDVDINTLATPILSLDSMEHPDVSAVKQFRRNAKKLMEAGSFPLAQAATRGMRQTESLLLNNGANIFMAKVLMAFVVDELKYMRNAGLTPLMDNRD